MENTCGYNIIVNQRACQNGISCTTNNVFTNITNDNTICLNFGYIITIISVNGNCACIRLSNSEQIPNLNFNINTNICKVFDLPVQNGNLRVRIKIIPYRCYNSCLCTFNC